MKQSYKHFEKYFLPGNIRRIKMLPEAVGVTAQNEFIKNFDRQAFFTRSWEPSQRVKRSGGSTLIGKQSGGLRRGLQFRTAGMNVVFTNNKPYAIAHNEGLTVKPRVTKDMRKFAWAMHYQAKKGSQEANKWKGLALTKKSRLNIKLPERRFVGKHPELDRAVEKACDIFLTGMFK